MNNQPRTIDLRLFATLSRHMPPNASAYPIQPGITVAQLLSNLQVPPPEIKLIFVNGIRAEIQTVLHGGERVGVFPPVGGG